MSEVTINNDSYMKIDGLLSDIDGGMESLVLIGYGRDACGYEADSVSAISFVVDHVKDDIKELRKLLKIVHEEE